MRPPDEIIAIETTIQIPGGDPSKKKFERTGHIYVLQIGSGENCQVRNECLANLHASIEVHEQSAYITNHDRVAGTVVNGQRIHDRVKVRHGDEIKCGDVMLDIGFLHPVVGGKTALPPSSETKNAYHCNGCGGEWALHPNKCTNRAHWDTYVGLLGKGLVEGQRIEGEKNVEIEGLTVQIARLNKELEVQKANVESLGQVASVVGGEIDEMLAGALESAGFFGGERADGIRDALIKARSLVQDRLLSFIDEDDKRDLEKLRKEQKSREMQFDAVIEISKKALKGVDIPEATAASSWAKILANQYRKARTQLETLKAEKSVAAPALALPQSPVAEPTDDEDPVRIRSERTNVPTHGRVIEHYLTMVEGVLALRIFGELSQSTEAEITGAHAALWERMTKADRLRLDGADGLIEQAKNYWKRMEKKA